MNGNLVLSACTTWRRDGDSQGVAMLVRVAMLARNAQTTVTRGGGVGMAAAVDSVAIAATATKVMSRAARKTKSAILAAQRAERASS